MHNPKLCIALDMQRNENLSLCNDLYKHNITDLYLKIGLRSFIRDGVLFVDEVKNLGFKIFLDLKLYDIPNTMIDSINEIVKLGVDIITIHTSSGFSVMNAIAQNLKDVSNAPLIFGVTALTSFNDNEFQEVYNCGIGEGVITLSQLASRSGIDGVVCSCLESKAIKDTYPSLLTLTPGVRPSKEDFSDIEIYNVKDDQARATSITFAMECKSDIIVIGRPIYTHKDPIIMTQKILEKLKG